MSNEEKRNTPIQKTGLQKDGEPPVQTWGAILIADDNPDDALHTQKVVERAHPLYPIHVVSSGEEAIAYLAGEGRFSDRDTYPYPTLVLLDLVMPRTDGFAVLQWLQTHPEHRHLSVIVLSVVRDLREVSRAYRLGARSFFMKPLTVDDFRTTVHALGIPVLKNGRLAAENSGNQLSA